MSRLVTLPGDLVSPVAGALLRRGCPVLCVESGRLGWAWYGIYLGDHADLDQTRDAVPFDGVRVAHVVPAVGAHLDLSDPAGRDVASRWLAAHHGLAVGATAPGWSLANGTWADPHWLLFAPWSKESNGRNFLVFCDGVPAPAMSDVPPITVPGISTLTDPAAALALACLAAVGRSA